MNMTKDIEVIMKGVTPEKFRDIPRELCKVLAGKGLSFRQAEAMLELAKDLLKDARI